jgi:ribose 5-phosphate isomerase B
MRIYIGSDHGGYELKEQIKLRLMEEGYEVEDVGNHLFDPGDDYVDFAFKVAESIEGGDSTDRGILLCRSGHGVEIVANRFPHVRAILGYNDDVTVQGRQHEDANILTLPADWITPEEAQERVRLFLETEKSTEERHERRRARIDNLRVKI